MAIATSMVFTVNAGINSDCSDKEIACKRGGKNGEDEDDEDDGKDGKDGRNGKDGAERSGRSHTPATQKKTLLPRARDDLVGGPYTPRPTTQP